MVSTRLGGEDSKKNSGDKKNQFTFFSFLANAKVCFIYSNNIFSKSHAVGYERGWREELFGRNMHCNSVRGSKQGYPCNENRTPATITGFPLMKT